MRKILAITMASMMALAVATPAAAQPWQTINARQDNMEARINAGVASGALTRQEAIALRTDFRALVALESNYRLNGLTVDERRDLDRRFDALDARIRYERHDGQSGNGWGNGNNWVNINERQRNLDARIDAGVRSGQITRQEAVRLRAEFRSLANLEASYRRNGLTMRERQDLDRRFDALSARIRYERNDGQNGWGNGNGNGNGWGNNGGNGWMNINQRQRSLEARIDAGVRSGAISGREAASLRAQFNDLERLEARYRATGGLSIQERRDLDRRFDALSARIRYERRD